MLFCRRKPCPHGKKQIIFQERWYPPLGGENDLLKAKAPK
jgi:hypothetical protein